MVAQVADGAAFNWNDYEWSRGSSSTRGKANGLAPEINYMIFGIGAFSDAWR